MADTAQGKVLAKHSNLIMRKRDELGEVHAGWPRGAMCFSFKESIVTLAPERTA